MHIENTILSLYDEEELSIEQIAEQTGYDAMSIKALLMQKSTRFKMERAGAAGQGTLSGDVSDHEYKMFLQMYKNIASDTDVDATTRARVLRDLMDEYKGRKEVVNSHKPEVNLILINQGLENVRKARARTLEIKPAVIEVNEQLTKEVA